MDRPKRPARAARAGPSSSHTHTLPPVLEIPELLGSILSFLEDPEDLVNVACTAKRFKDTALRIAWAAPECRGAPLLRMVHLFPPDIARELLQAEEDHFRVPANTFERFDYYAKFVRHVEIWRAIDEQNIARILSQSRPGRWMFPSLETVHLGATGEDVRSASLYLTPTLRSVRINHWNLETSSLLSSPLVINVLLQILRLPHLDSLDLLDTRYPAYEQSTELVGALLNVIPQLRSFLSCDFTTLPPVFDALSRSSVLTDLFVDLGRQDANHLQTQQIITALRHAFTSLRRLVLLCSREVAADILMRLERGLGSLDLRIDGPLLPDGLGSITTLLPRLSPSLLVFRCASSQPDRIANSPPLRDALEPMITMFRLQHIYIALTFEGAHTLKDADIATLFPAWPRLCTFIIESDPQDEDSITEEDPEGYGLTLNSLVDITRYCPFLTELTLAYMDTSVIPDLSSRLFVRSPQSLALHLSRSHVHDQQGLYNFISQVWPNVELSYKTCCPSRADAPSDG